MLLNLVEVSFGHHIRDVWIAGSVNICVHFRACPDISDKCTVIK